ncbi:MAG: ABC transporter ATP-binding protein [Firmicutes bacterium]|nr:ABC transporter ATP-binding protein [Bacillota bacterium]
MIKTEGLSKSFDRIAAVDRVDLHVEKGQIFGLVGPDGAGKTTLLRMICGLITPSAGQAYIMGHPIEKLDLVRENLGYMPQRFSLYGDLTIMENISFFGALYKLDSKTIRQRADEILAVTNLIEFKSRFADDLSGGMKQKLALTCALITRPGILVLDEPTYGVDPESRKEFWKILYHLNREGMTILSSTPYMDEAELCHVVAIMNEGRLAAVDSPVNLKRGLKQRMLEVRVGAKDPNLFEGLPAVLDSSFYGDRYHLAVEDPAAAREEINGFLVERGLSGGMIEEIVPSMEDVFVALAEKEVS